jgi:predicted nucleic acid-binding protein
VAEVVFDTTFFIDLRRGRRAEAIAYWKGLQRGGIRCCYSPVSAYELWIGQRIDREEELFHLAVFNELHEIALSTAAASEAGRWLRGKNRDVSDKVFRDDLIAATASTVGATVCTSNVRDFALFPVEIESY